MTLCILLYRAFKCTRKVQYLNEAISSARNGINAVDSLGGRPLLLHSLILFLSTHLELLHQEEDLRELMQLFPTAADHSLGGLHGWLTDSFDWATIARRFRHPSALTAYDHAMSLFQDSLTFAPTLDKQHSRLVATRSLHTIPLDYASYHISTGNVEQAIVTLERGRGLLWSEMRGLRTSMDQIRLADSNLADKFSAVNQELKTLTLTFSLNNNVDGNSDLKGMDPYGHTMMRKQKLLDDREKLITQIQGLSGFDTFLKPPTFDTLCSAASHGTVIIINHCKWRSDGHTHSFPPQLSTLLDSYFRRVLYPREQIAGSTTGGTKEGPRV